MHRVNKQNSLSTTSVQLHIATLIVSHVIYILLKMIYDSFQTSDVYVPCPLNHFLYIHRAIYVLPSLPSPSSSSHAFRQRSCHKTKSLVN